MIEASLVVRRGAFVLDASIACHGVAALIGPNGSGKTTLLRALLGALPLERGRVEVRGRVLFDSTRAIDVPTEERAIAYVPQGYGLFPHLSALENVMFGIRGGTRAERRDRAVALLGDLDVRAAAERRPSALSGGEQQRVALARALAIEPALLLLDEPLAALDASARPRVRRFLSRWLEEAGLPALVVTHEPADARELASHLVVLEAGVVTQEGPIDDVVAHPATALVAAVARRLLDEAPKWGEDVE